MATSPIRDFGDCSDDQVQVDAKPRDLSPSLSLSPPLVIGVAIVIVVAPRAAIRAGCNQAAIHPIDLPIPSVRPSVHPMAMVTSLAAAAIDLPLPSLPDILDSAGLDRKPMDRPTDHGRTRVATQKMTWTF